MRAVGMSKANGELLFSPYRMLVITLILRISMRNYLVVIHIYGHPKMSPFGGLFLSDLSVGHAK